MSRTKSEDCHDFRKKITDPTQLFYLRKISKEWCLTVSELCWRFITEGVRNEREKKDDKGLKS